MRVTPPVPALAGRGMKAQLTVEQLRVAGWISAEFEVQGGPTTGRTRLTPGRE